MLEILGGIVVLLIMIALSGVKVVREHERMVVFRFGKVVGSRGPGLNLVLPVIERLLIVDTRMVTMPVETGEVVTYDDAVVSLSAVFMFEVFEAASFVTKVADAYQATAEAAEVVLCEVAREKPLTELQTDTRRYKQRVRVLLDKKIKTWGIKTSDMEVKDVKLIAENRPSEKLPLHVEHVPTPIDYFANTNDYLKQPATVAVPGFDGDLAQSYDFGDVSAPGSVESYSFSADVLPDSSRELDSSLEQALEPSLEQSPDSNKTSF